MKMRAAGAMEKVTLFGSLQIQPRPEEEWDGREY
jgi:hypothetical protein